MVETLDAADAPRVADVLADAFHEYRVMRFVVGETAADYAPRLRRLVGFFVANRVLRGEPLFGIVERGELQAAAIASFPHRPGAPPELETMREALWRDFGPEMKDRYEACGRVWQGLAVPGPQVHLNMIGVRRGRQGRGLARRLLDRVHELSRDTPESTGVSLTTEHPDNVPLYQHVGYQVVGHARIAPTLETWGFFRHD